MLHSGGWRIGRVFGIDIEINATWLIIFFLFALSFGETFLRWEPVHGRLFPGGVWPWVIGFITGIIFFACLLAHELSHSFIATRNGISIERITLFIFGGVAQMKEDVTDAATEFKMAIAGPLVTFAIAGIFYLLLLAAYAAQSGPALVAPLRTLVEINVFIGVFNLLPGFPLDGGRVLRSFLWKRSGNLQKATRVASIGGQAVAIIVMLSGIAVSFITGSWVTGAWAVLIGIFLFRLAQASYQQTLLHIAASDTKARDIMYTDVPVVGSDTTLTTLKTDSFTAYRLPSIPVADEGGKIIGTVSREDLEGVSLAEWDLLNAGRLAKSISLEQVVQPDEALDSLLRHILTGQEFLLVMEGQTLLGVVTKEEIMHYMETRLNLLKK